MTITEPLDVWVRAVESRDGRFDGWVIVGVTSTGIYCRPSCPTPVRPKRANMAFFSTPAAAQAAGFRACKRCRPDALPGSPAWHHNDDLVSRAVRAIEAGALDRDRVGVLASGLGVSNRHLQRLLVDSVGASPVALARARRARVARSLIEQSDLAFGDVAFASGFESIRQFNETIRAVFDRTPTEIRGHRGSAVGGGFLDLGLAVREPFDRGAILRWLAAHAVGGVEEIDGWVYRRSLRLSRGPGIVEVDLCEPRKRSEVSEVGLRVLVSSLDDLPDAISRVRRLLDLDADPRHVNDLLEADPHLGPLIAHRPGLRSPGAADPSDAMVSTIVGQQVSLASARGVLTRLVARHGERLADPVAGVTHVFPSPDVWASLDPDELGMPKRRAATVVAASTALAEGTIDLSPGADRRLARAQLLEVAGIGPWTAEVVAMRALSDPDAFPASDLVLLRRAAILGLPATADALNRHARRWQPWRAYALHHIWAGHFDEPAAIDSQQTDPESPREGNQP